MGSPAHPVSGVPRALTIAGSDSGGGAGIQADLKVFMALGCHGMSALTALTAQNTVGVSGIHEVPADFVREQIDAVVSDIGVDATKTGMLASAEIVAAVAKAIRDHDLGNVVVDPVSVSKHGSHLLRPDAVAALREDLLPVATLITPNLHEAGVLCGTAVETIEQMRAAARTLHGFGPQAVLVKGGHLPEQDAADVYFDGERMEELRGPRFDTDDTHGTGCALSAAICAHLARGQDLFDAVVAGKTFVTGAIDRGLRIGRGYGPVNPAWNLGADAALGDEAHDHQAGDSDGGDS